MTIAPPVQLIQDAYGISDIALSAFGCHFLLRSRDQGHFLVKPIVRSKEEAGALEEAMRYLVHKGFLSALPWLATQNKTAFFMWNGDFWALTTWVDGHPAPVFTLTGIPIFLKRFRELHRLGEHAPYGTPFSARFVFEERLSDLSQGFHCSGESPWANRYRKHLPDHLPTAQNAVEILKSAADSFTLCHGDPSSQNTRLRPDGSWVLVDWDRLVRAPRWWELAQIARRFGAYHRWRPDPMRRFSSLLQEIAALNPEEYRGFFGALLFPQEFWRLGYQYFYERRRSEIWFQQKLSTVLQWEQRRLLTIHQLQRALLGKEVR